LVTIAEDPYATSSTLSNTTQFTFDDLPTGLSSNVTWDGVGTFDSLYVSDANVWGGAYNELTGSASQFSWQGSRWTPTSTLSLDQSSSYFGFWWSAGDRNNQISFYNQDDLIARFTTESMFGSLSLSQDYYGNPLTGGNSREPYAFINFFGDAETSWDRIELTQLGGGGFESDNYTTRVESFNPEVDTELSLGKVIAEVSGDNTDIVEEPTEDWVWGYEQNAPGAPIPPLFALLIFATLAVIKTKIN